MLHVAKYDPPVLQYHIHGKLTAEDLRTYYTRLDTAYARAGRLDVSVVARDFRGYAGFPAVRLLVRNEAKLLWKVRKYRLYTDGAKLTQTVRLLARLIFWMDIEVQTLRKTPDALQEYDRRCN